MSGLGFHRICGEPITHNKSVQATPMNAAVSPMTLGLVHAAGAASPDLGRYARSDLL